MIRSLYNPNRKVLFSERYGYKSPSEDIKNSFLEYVGEDKYFLNDNIFKILAELEYELIGLNKVYRNNMLSFLAQRYNDSCFLKSDKNER